MKKVGVPDTPLRSADSTSWATRVPYAPDARSYPFEQAGDAHRYLAERRNIGKVVLTPQ